MIRLPLFFVTGLFMLVAPMWAQSAGAPTIASLSSSQTLTEGQDLTLSVSVNGTAPFTYQWRKGSTALASATNSTLAFTPLRVADAGTYTVVVTNSAGSVTSGAIVLAVNAAVAPSFYYQPSSASFTVGDTLNLSASVNGTAPLTFVWKKGTTVLQTSSSAYYSKANVQSADAGSYTVTVSNLAGSITSSAIAVTVNPITAPTFSYGLYDVSVELGGSLYFSPSVSGSGAITYQWKKDGVAIPGATSYYFSKYGITAADAGSYTLTATNSAGSSTSNAARVTVLPAVAPTISSISSPVSVVVGDSFNLSVYVNGTAPFTFQWRKDGQAISGATNNYFSKSSVEVADAGSYSVVVTNTQGSVTSAGVTVAITNARPPIITFHPPSIAVQLGAYISSLSVGVSGTGALTYQWSKNGVPISGANSSSYYFGSYATDAIAGTYTVVVTGAQGSATSEPCYVTVLPASAPVIVRPPASQSVRQGDSFGFDVQVTGTPYPTFQWRKDGVNISGATDSGYYKSNVASSDAGAYSVVVTNSAGTATSEAANVTVRAATVPKIISHPASASLLPGDYFYGMFVGLANSVGTTIQWYRDGVLLPGATGSSYYIYNAQPSIAGTYTAVATNSIGSVTSREAVITVDANTTRPVITYVQGSRSLPGGESAYLQIATSSSGESVQWFKDGVIIANATSKEYSFSNFGLGSVGTYTAQVSNTSGTFTSRPIVLELLDSGTAPIITLQPVSQNLPAGWSAGFSVSVVGETPMTYQWRKDGVAIPGATWNNHYISSAVSTALGVYSVVVTNRNGSATSSAATLTAQAAPTTAPVITQHPASQTRTQGSGSFELYVSVLNSTGVTFQWKKDGAAIPGATSYYYHANAISANAGRYSVVASNSAGNATSYDAVVGITSATTGPTFTTQPASIDGFLGNSATFTSAATGASTLTYQWRKNGVAVAGATNSSLTLNSLQASDAGTYTVIATDANGSTPSAAATLTVTGGTAPFIITSPASVSAMVGTGATFNSSVGGTPVPTVQWQRNGADVPGATTLSLNIPSVKAADAGNYTLVARSPVGSATSSMAVLTVVFPPPTITTQPTNVTVQPGAPASFSVIADAQPDPTYQWRKDGVNLAGATTSTLIFSSTQASQAGRYSVIVSTAFGSVTSVDALLAVGNPVIASMSRSVVAKTGASVTLAASIQSADPLLFRWARNGVVIAGATSSSLTLPAVQVSDSGVYSLEISRTNGTVVYPLTGSAALTTSLTVEAPTVPVITQQPVGATVAIGATVTLAVRATDSGPITFQWQKNGVPIPDQLNDTLVLRNVQPSDAADYRAVAIGRNGSTSSNLVRVEITGSPFAGTYFGTFPNGDAWALHVTLDGSGVFIAMLSSLGQVIMEQNVTVQSSGAFRFGRAQSVAAAGAAAYSARIFEGEVSGLIAGSTISGQVFGANLPLSGQRVNLPPMAGVRAGFYQAVPLASDLGEVCAIAAPNGAVLLVAVDATGVRGGRGTVEANGLFTVTQPQYAYRGAFAVDTGMLQGVYAPNTGTHVPFASAAGPASSERLINVATRGLAGSDARTLTAGFVITGNTTKEVLIRAVGPTLAGFGVSGVLANPRLRIFRGSAAILENDDWGLSGFAPQIADAGGRVGAFALTAGSADAAILARLEPGAYTAQISSDAAAAGVALVEVYDTVAPKADAPKLVNLSTRGEVGRDGDILIVGVVVSGTAAKKLLIRGIGPGLADFGVADALLNPKLQLYQGTTLVRENDNWSDSTDAAALATAASAVGAFPLASGSKDAVLLLYLAPGAYTAQISGVGNTTGVALVEAYEVP
jgi:hypothetical protein